MGAGFPATCAITRPCLCADSDSSVEAKVPGPAQGNCSMDIFGNVEVSIHNEIQNQAPSIEYGKFLYSAAIAKTTEVCAGQAYVD